MKHYSSMALMTAWLLCAGAAHAQLFTFPGAKILDSGPTVIGACKSTPTPFSFTIHLMAHFTPTHVVKDVVPPVFLVESVNPSCGTATVGWKKKDLGKLTWKLTGCDPLTSQDLHVVLKTAQKPKQPSGDSPLFAPRFCGPLALNKGAVLVNTQGTEVSELSNSLFVAACLTEETPGCVDADSDGWSGDCGDCNDNDPVINPDATEKCGDTVDNNCNGQQNESC